MTPRGRERRGVVLIVVLWGVAILAVVCLALGGTVRFKQAHLRRNRSELTAQEALLSAVALAKTLLLEDPAAADTEADAWSGGDAVAFTLHLNGTTVRLSCPPGLWGLEDESARLNANTASAEMLAKLPGMTVSVAGAFVAARDRMRQAGSEGGLLAETPGLTGPFARPGQLAQALVAAFGQVGLGGPGEDRQGRDGETPEPCSWASQAGLPAAVVQAMEHLTVHSRQRNLDARGRPRANLNAASRAELAAALGEHFNDEQIDAIILARAVKPFVSIGELLTREMEITGPEGEKKPVRIGREQLKPVADRLTVTDAEVLGGLVNVNTAPAEVLRALPGLTEADAAAIIAFRSGLAGQGAGSAPEELTSVGWLLEVLSEKSFAEVWPFVTVRSQQFRMRAEACPDTAEGASAETGRSHPEASAYAMAVLERDGGRCNVLLWLGWTAPTGSAPSR